MEKDKNGLQGPELQCAHPVFVSAMVSLCKFTDLFHNFHFISVVDLPDLFSWYVTNLTSFGASFELNKYVNMFGCLLAGILYKRHPFFAMELDFLHIPVWMNA